VVVKKKRCIRCGACAAACPADAIYLDPSGEPFVCIHCGRCVEFCPHDCLEGCIHLGFVREKFKELNQYLYRQVTYDHEPIFAMGAMLSVLDAFQVLTLLEIVEKMGLDVMSAGVALAWATEAFEKGILSENETMIPLKFGDAGAYGQALKHLGAGANDFYRVLGQGTLKAAELYGGADFACALKHFMAPQRMPLKHRSGLRSAFMCWWQL
jgi:aldehyde:ferredoxin oxidoreductase